MRQCSQYQVILILIQEDLHLITKIQLGADGMSYSDNENYKNNWSVRFSGSMYEKLYEWLQNNKDSMEEIHKFSTWQKVFDEIGGTYERVWSKEELDQGYLNN